jgi:hypothetical protein
LDWCQNPIKRKRNYTHTYKHTYENYNFWLTNFVMIIEMANRLMKQSTVYIHQAGDDLMYMDRKTDEAESSLLHLFVTNKLRQAATQPLKTTVF